MTLALSGMYLGMELLGRMVTAFQFWQTLFQSSCIILQSHQQCMWIAMSSYPHQHSLLCLFDYSHLNECEVVISRGFDLHFSAG